MRLLKTFTNPFQALAFLQEQQVGLIFLDINMPDISGIDFLKSVRNRKAAVIFTTAHSEYALESYELEALDYLLKPFEFSRFLRAVTKAQERMSQREDSRQDFFFVNTGYQQRRLCFSDILCVESSGNYVTYHTADEKVLVRSSIRETLSLLPLGLFVQIHRSFIVSLKKIDKIQNNHVFVGEHKLSIGPGYRESLMKIVAPWP